jgi:hypothetical protein
MEVCGKEVRIEAGLVRIARLSAEWYEFLEDPAAAVADFGHAGVGADLFTFVQKLPETSRRYRYPMERDNVAALAVSTFDYWWTRQIDFRVRNKVRKAEKSGVVVREVPFDDGLVRGISAIYNESPIRQGRLFRHYGEDLERVRRENQTFLDRSVFLGAFLGQSLVGFAKLVSDEHEGQAGLMKIMSMIQHADKAPTNALIARAVRSCAERRMQYLVYANFASRRKTQDTLGDFKRHNGFERIELPRYYVPLSLWGRVALGLGLHRGLVDNVPEPVLAQLRRMRSLWYRRRFQAVT